MGDHHSFTWIKAGRLLAGPYPDSADVLNALREEGVRTLINLTHRSHDAGVMSALGLREVGLPVRDFTAPSPEILRTAVEVISSTDLPIAIHCRGGLGRTGTVVAAWLTSEGLAAEEAIARVRALRPGSIETSRQEAAVHKFAALQASTRRREER